MKISQEFSKAKIVSNLKEWNYNKKEALNSFNLSNKRIKTASKNTLANLSNVDLNDYLLTQVIIVASVNPEEDSYTIKEPCMNLVNANGNSWLSEVLGPPTNIFRSFKGAENFYEHFQNIHYSKGKILDCALRKTKYNDEDIYVVDILVATNKKHNDLVSRIRNGNLTTMSMGAIAYITQCSKCGKIIYNEWQNCNHIKHELGQTYKTKYGNKSKVSELCGVKGNQNSCKFIEASWVEQPAFEGATLSYYISQEDKAKLLEANMFNTGDFNWNLDVNEFDKVKVADKKGKRTIKLIAQILKENRKNILSNRLFNENF